MNSAIKSDVYRVMGRSDTRSVIKCIMKNPGARFMFFFRLASQKSKFTPAGMIARYFYKKYTYKYGIQIPKTVKIGEGFLIMHFGCIVINSRATIGNNCTILQGATIGQSVKEGQKGAPVIGNRVYIGPGAMVIGRITIGNNVLIAPNAFVNFDVPSNSIVIGNPGKIIENKNDATASYITNTVTEPVVN